MKAITFLSIFLFSIVFSKTYDVIVIGGGPSGNGFAYQTLLDHPDSRVLLLERGFDDTDIPSNFYPDLNSLTSNDTSRDRPLEFDWTRETSFLTGKDFSLEHFAKNTARSIAAGAILRNNPSDFLYWQSQYNIDSTSWNYTILEPHYIAMENYSNIFHPQDPIPSDRGTQGPIKIFKTDYFDPDTLPFNQAFQQAYNVDYNPDLNARPVVMEGIGSFDRNLGHSTQQPIRRHDFYQDSLKQQALTNDRFDLELGSTVTKIELRSDGDLYRAKRVFYIQNGIEKSASLRSNGHVFVSAGVTNTPKILMFSGIGDCDKLEAKGLSCLIDAPGVGQNLAGHPTIPQFFSGFFPFTDGPNAGLFTTSPYRAGSGMVDTEVSWKLTSSAGVPAFLVINTELQQDTRGELILRYPDPLKPLSIRLGYDYNPFSIASLRKAWNFLQTREALKIYTNNTGIPTFEVIPGYDVVPEDAELFDVALRLQVIMQSEFHGAGTARIGKPDDPNAVADEYDYRVYGTTNVHVGAASGSPYPPRNHPNLFWRAIGMELAKRIGTTSQKRTIGESGIRQKAHQSKRDYSFPSSLIKTWKDLPEGQDKEKIRNYIENGQYEQDLKTYADRWIQFKDKFYQ